jgi:tRNA-splicing ligase RtcB
MQTNAELDRQIQWIASQPDILKIAVMPDSHPGLTVPNGLAVATSTLLYPQLVGSDIGCGYSALRFDSPYTSLDKTSLEKLLVLLLDEVPTLKHSPNRAANYRSLIETLGPLSDDRLSAIIPREGTHQLGTLGRGNHFLELAHDDADRLWCVVHTGSRGMGQAISEYHLRAATDNSSPKNLIGIPAQTSAGSAYLEDMNWGCQYATLNRSLILNAVADLLESHHSIAIDESSYIDSPHNFLVTMPYANQTYYVHRKSANSAAINQPGIIAGTMATGCLITCGLGDPDSLHSSAHGAGRAMSRTEAATKIRTRDIAGQMNSIVYRKKDIQHFRDEGPQAYKNIHQVMQAQKAQVRVVEKLTPVLNDKRF